MKRIILPTLALLVHSGAFATVSDVSAEKGSLGGAGRAATLTVTRPDLRWLFGGMGFQHAEAALTPLMTDEFRDERALKTFREIEPTCGRVYTGFSACPRARLDRFADYYDLTFRRAGTTLYAVPSTMPGGVERIDPAAYAAGCASNLAYLVRERNCRKIRWYGLTNEMGTLDAWGWYIDPARRPLYARFTSAVADSIRREGLDIGVVGPDFSGGAQRQAELMRWTAKELDASLGAYVTHWYVYNRTVGDLRLWDEYRACFATNVAVALDLHKRWFLGEFGFSPTPPRLGVMVDDWSVNGRRPDLAPRAALSLAEMALAAMNAGASMVICWSFADYPDPFILEDGDTEAEKARFDVGQSCYRPDLKYNKWGMFRWSDGARDYRAYPNLYTMGPLARFFRKGSTVLPVANDAEAEGVRAGAVENPDGSVSVAVINWGAAKTLSLAGAIRASRPLRRYVYEAARVPENAFNDLPGPVGTVAARDGGAYRVELPADSLTILTSDYRDRAPPSVEGLKLADGVLAWKPATDPDHRYYRVYRRGRQIASTVAERFDRGIEAGDKVSDYAVRSVDRWGNVAP